MECWQFILFVYCMGFEAVIFVFVFFVFLFFIIISCVSSFTVCACASFDKTHRHDEIQIERQKKNLNWENKTAVILAANGAHNLRRNEREKKRQRRKRQQQHYFPRLSVDHQNYNGSAQCAQIIAFEKYIVTIEAEKSYAHEHCHYIEQLHEFKFFFFSAFVSFVLNE